MEDIEYLGSNYDIIQTNMLNKTVKFLTYNNAVPLTLGILFLGSGIVFASSEEVREIVSDTVYAVEKSVVTIDNTYIANKNLDSFSPSVNITNITEDDDIYYVEYNFNTIALKDYVWQDVTNSLIIEVEKKVLISDSLSLGDYVTEQLRQEVKGEASFLREIQEKSRNNTTNKVVATAYSGLVGKLIDDTTEKLPKHVPVKVVASVSVPTNNTPTPAVTEGPSIEILGANPARIEVKSTYSDLGAFVVNMDGTTLGLSVELSINGEVVNSIDIDTSEPKDWSIGYSATDQNGNTAFAERVVIVFDPNVSEEVIEPTEETATTTEEVATTTEEVIDVIEETATTTEAVVILEVIEVPAEEVIATTTEETIAEEETSTSTPSE